jgi:2-hydroxychromene-2-carboxylate isomerase
MTRILDFWFEFASTYSYLSAQRIEPMAAEQGVDVRWRPFLLGPIFKAQGWSTSPFNLFEAKGRYMVRDVGRIASERNIAFRLPSPFPQNSLLAARVAAALTEPHRKAAFCRAVFVAEFADGKQIDDPAVIGSCLEQAGGDIAAAMREAGAEQVKLALREATSEAQRRGIFGAPTFVTEDGELFWGDDRLEMALRWAAAKDR